MPHTEFQIIETGKLGGGWAQELAVVRNGQVYLRMAGNGTDYRVMTATAGEDFGPYRPCKDQPRLHDAATLFARTHGCEEDIDTDSKGRPYVILFTMSQKPEATDAEFTAKVTELIEEFFGVFDTIHEPA